MIINFCAQYGQSPLLQDIQLRIKARWTKTRPNPLLLYAIAQVHERLEKSTKNEDMLNKFIELREADKNKVSLDEIAGAVYINLYASTLRVSYAAADNQKNGRS